jgi:hypothetical protein
MNETKATVLLASTGVLAVTLLVSLVPQFKTHAELVKMRQEAQETAKKADEADAKITARLADLANERWEYKVVSVMAEGHDRNGAAAVKFASAQPDEKALTKLGGEGWELVGSYLEMETSYPNFGKEEYVTGIQPNIRPQRAVLLLRRRLPR